MLDEIKEGNPETKLVLCEPFALPVEPLKENYEVWNTMLEPLQQQIYKISEEYGAIFVPLQNKFDELCGLEILWHITSYSMKKETGNPKSGIFLKNCTKDSEDTFA